MTSLTGPADQDMALPSVDELPVPQRPELADVGRALAEDVACLVRDLPETAIPIPGAEWTVGETAAHLAFVTIGMTLIARGLEVAYTDESLPARQALAEANARALEGYTERDGAVLADRIANGAKIFVAEALAQPPDRMCTTPMGVFPIDVLMSYFVAHNLQHGCAIARALHRPYPFEAGHLRFMWPFLRHAFPLLVAPSAAGRLDGSIEVRARGVFRFVARFDQGRLSVGGSASRPVDCTVETSPLAFVLLGTKLVDVSEMVARGEVTVWGPRPDLGFRFPAFFDIP